MNMEQISLIAQKIMFAVEDQFFDKEKRGMFDMLFNRYLQSVDPENEMDTYDALVLFGQRYPSEFEYMLKEMREKDLLD